MCKDYIISFGVWFSLQAVRLHNNKACWSASCWQIPNMAESWLMLHQAGTYTHTHTRAHSWQQNQISSQSRDVQLILKNYTFCLNTACRAFLQNHQQPTFQHIQVGDGLQIDAYYHCFFSFRQKFLTGHWVSTEDDVCENPTTTKGFFSLLEAETIKISFYYWNSQVDNY